VERLERFPALHVTGDANRTPPQRFNLTGNLAHLFESPRTRHNIRTSASQPNSDRVSKSGCSTGYHRDSSVQIEEILGHEFFLYICSRPSYRVYPLIVSTVASAPKLYHQSHISRRIPRHLLTVARR
jgi:hypothetical protein